MCSCSSQEYARQLEERHTLRQLRTRVDALKKGYAWSLVTDAEDALEQVMSSHNARVGEHCEASDAEEKVRGEQAELRGECEAKQAHLEECTRGVDSKSDERGAVLQEERRARRAHDKKEAQAAGHRKRRDATRRRMETVQSEIKDARSSQRQELAVATTETDRIRAEVGATMGQSRAARPRVPDPGNRPGRRG